MKSVALLCGLLASSVSAHVQMSNPYPIRSPLNPNGGDNKDYSYTNPLSSDGHDFPCKGYANDPFSSVANYSPGGSYSLELQGSATHEGGSCQISLSYDQGKSFKVIHSMIGGCPLTSKYQFSVPSDAPGGQALLAWSWFNKVGNREMYMNCAQVTIGGSKKREVAQQEIAGAVASFSSAPPMFIANINGPGGCTTIEGQDVNFPLPGSSVEGSGSGTGYTCTGSADFLGGSHGTNSAVSSSSSSSSHALTSSGAGASSPSSSSSSSASSHSASKVASAFGSNTEHTVLLPTVPAPAPAEPESDRFAHGASHGGNTHGTAHDSSHGSSHGSGSCVDNTIICDEDGKTWALCAHGRPVHMGSVADGTYCKHGAMHAA
ncbi:uncharacterized protein BP01DRAFT_358593 [Aspergillus saccharolyticus JOP 1030-1]|uniref:Extracellular protein n=1 Tax=Aspergillus saccharolyticus JOP 1030-1 TaxID=1450539 RepID=A0A318ZTE0_9EURO|nr:hypothetical protein BP01DRAFT_358593 [Aspergillus saccharolyticus JOP 1030-1]PYH43338.1 hypothetical protein BP01DRAFT_358593 [Aspergillus saccharolyticus JOP 1030-1]